MAEYDKDNKLYWLILKDDFFEDDAIKIFERMDNGYRYCNFYLKLCLKSLKSAGILILKCGEVSIPYDDVMLSQLTNVDLDTVKSAMVVLIKLGLIKVLENRELYMSRVENMIGKQSIGAFKKQQQRLVKSENDRKMLEGGQMSSISPPECPLLPSISISNSISNSNNIIEDINNKKENIIKEKFVPPTLDEVKAYAVERNRLDLAEKFYDYFCVGKWIDSKGKKVVNWKQKFIVWASHNDNNNTSSSQQSSVRQNADGSWKI
jgi:predicted phage replisome organizer